MSKAGRKGNNYETEMEEYRKYFSRGNKRTQNKNAVKLKKFYECHSQEELIKYGLLVLIDRSLIRQTDQKIIKKLCEMRKSLASKLP